MKKVIFLFITSTCILFAQNTSDTQIHIKDTVVTKTIAVKINDTFFNLNFWQTLTSVGTGIILTLIGVYFTNRHQRKLTDKQIQQQLEVKQAEIDVASKRKFIDDMIEQTKNISKSVFSIIQFVNDLHDYYFRRGFDKNDKVETEKIDHKISVVYDDIRLNREEFYYSSSILFFYLNKNDDSYLQLKVLVDQLKNSYERYSGYFWSHSYSSDNYDNEMKQHGLNLKACYNALKDKTQEIIDTERKNIYTILK